MRKVANLLFRTLLAVVLVLVSLRELARVSSNNKIIRANVEFIGRSLGGDYLSFITQNSNEFQYFYAISGVYSGILCLFAARMTKPFAVIFFLLNFLLLSSLSQLAEFKTDTVSRLLTKASILGGVLSI